MLVLIKGTASQRWTHSPRYTFPGSAPLSHPAPKGRAAHVPRWLELMAQLQELYAGEAGDTSRRSKASIAAGLCTTWQYYAVVLTPMLDAKSCV